MIIKKQSKPIMLSGIQPSNNLTLGNYLGAIKPFVQLQDKYKMFVFVADLHAITNVFDPIKLHENRKKIVCFYYACGLDFDKTIIFYQSNVQSHNDLAHVLLCHTTIGELSRMTQFKAKSSQNKAANNTSFIPTGLLTYPALMAADILLYDADAVIVGNDQKQHVELTRNIAIRFNNKYCSENNKIFQIPEPIILKTASRVMDLQDPSIKMSKSNANPHGVIYLTDTADVINEKIMKAKTDNLNTVKYDKINQPGISNLLEIYAALTNRNINDICQQYLNIANYKEFKIDLAKIIINELTKIQAKYKVALDQFDQKFLPILEKNAIICTEIVQKKTNLVYKLIGLN